MIPIVEQNFVLVAAKAYDNPACHSVEEFQEDLMKFTYIKRLFIKYRDKGELRERLVLNHLIVVFNLFGAEATRLLFFKLEGYWELLCPFLEYMGQLPEVVHRIGKHEVVVTQQISADQTIRNALRSI